MSAGKPAPIRRARGSAPRLYYYMTDKSLIEFILPSRQPPKRSDKKKELYLLLFARSDLQAAREACNLFIKTVDDIVHPLYYPLYASIVVCYVRPFTNNKPFGSIPKRFYRFSDQSLKELHNELVDARHEFIAHSDMRLRRALIVPKGVAFGKINGKDLKFSKTGTAINNTFQPVAKFSEYLKLIIFNEKRIKSDIDKLTNELYGGMDLPRKSFDLKIDEGL